MFCVILKIAKMEKLIKSKIFSANSRICMKTCEVGEQKLKMEAGMTVVANVWSIHLDKKLWGEDAEQFIPERWDPDADRLPKDPYAYQPFGLGPRQCMGMKFGLLEIKLMYCHLLKRFEICRNEKTKVCVHKKFLFKKNSFFYVKFEHFIKTCYMFSKYVTCFSIITHKILFLYNFKL
jgi:hypothetical protein